LTYRDSLTRFLKEIYKIQTSYLKEAVCNNEQIMDAQL
jgi:hypothetical protein